MLIEVVVGVVFVFQMQQAYIQSSPAVPPIPSLPAGIVHAVDIYMDI